MPHLPTDPVGYVLRSSDRTVLTSVCSRCGKGRGQCRRAASASFLGRFSYRTEGFVLRPVIMGQAKTGLPVQQFIILCTLMPVI